MDINKEKDEQQSSNLSNYTEIHITPCILDTEKLTEKQKQLLMMILEKTRHCKHRNPDCIMNAFEGFITNIKYGL